MLSLWGPGSHLLSSLEMSSIAALTFSMLIVHSSLPTARALKLCKFTTARENIFYTADNLSPKHSGGELYHMVFC